MRRPTFSSTIFTLQALLAPTTVPLRAQTVSFQAGATSFGDWRQPEFGVRVSPPRGAVLGADFSFDVYPNFFLAAALLGIADLSLAVRVQPAPAVAIVGRAGGSAFVGGSAAGSLVVTGVGGGLGIVVAADSRTTVRLDYTYRRLQPRGEPYPVSSVTFGFMVHH